MSDSAVFSVSGLNNYLRRMIRLDIISRSVTVRGEISNHKYHSAGNIYFTLKDKDATLKCMMFASERREGLKFELKDGQLVEVRGRIDIYPLGGTYQLYATSVSLAGEGQLYARFIELKNRLEEEGLFSKEYKREIPKFVKRLGVCTAATGAAVRDIINIAKRRYPGIEIIIFSAYVQGAEAPSSIIEGLKTLPGYDVDVIIVGRGGGSIEDLWAFNDENVARAIFESPVPVISAVGHETDFTIADFAADLRAPTPSAAAELAVFDYRETADSLYEYKLDLLDLIERNIEKNKNILLNLEKELRYLGPEQLLSDLKQRIDTCGDRLNAQMLLAISERKNRILPSRDKLEALMREELQKTKHKLSIASERMKLLSPLNRLSDGYARVDTDKKFRISSVDDINADEIMHIYFKDGRINARAIEKSKIDFEKR